MNASEKLRAAQGTARDYEQFSNELLALVNRIVAAGDIKPNENIAKAVGRLRQERDRAKATIKQLKAELKAAKR